MRIDSLRLTVLVLLSGVVCIGGMYSVASMVIAHWVFPHHAEGSRWVQEGRVESQWIALYSLPGAASIPTERFPTPTQPFPVWMQAHLMEPPISYARSFTRTIDQVVGHVVDYKEDYREAVSFMVDEFLTPFLDKDNPTLHWTLPMQPITINTLHRHSAPSSTPQWMLALWSPTTPTRHPD